MLSGLRCSSISKVLDVKKGAFNPPPKVDSTVLLFELHPNEEVDYQKASKLVEAGFRETRTKLINNLRKTLSEDWEKIESPSSAPGQ